jgi:hypothetical protein
LNQEVSQKILEAKARVEEGQASTFEEVVGHSQPQKSMYQIFFDRVKAAKFIKKADP